MLAPCEYISSVQIVTQPWQAWLVVTGSPPRSSRTGWVESDSVGPGRTQAGLECVRQDWAMTDVGLGPRYPF